MSLIEDLNHLRIPFQDIKEATQNFTTLIGRGGYGPVFRGELSLSGELTVVAVKKLQTDQRSAQGLKEFLTEIQLLSRYKHPNIVSLVGFCQQGTQRFLIYEYAERGSLDKYLKPMKNRCPLTWRQRINICVDAARSLDHLHNHVATNQRIIHRDIKSGNILLDHNWKAMIADFGLSKLGRANESVTYVITNACGTYGYCDPAYLNSGILTKECDVYSFGVVLFEVLCGRLCFQNGEQEYLAPLAQRYYKEKMLSIIIDDDLKKYMNSYSMNIVSEIAYKCLLDDRKQRPSMGLVLKKLEQALKVIEVEDSPELQFEDEVEIEILEVKNLSPSNIEWDNRLPSDYKQFIYYSNKEMMKKPQGNVIFPTKEEAYSILSMGVLIKVNYEVNIWFWITKSNGKKCVILPPTLVSYENQPLRKIKRKPSNESRIEYVLHLSPSKVVGMCFKVPIGLLSTNTTYGCYLVYKLPQGSDSKTLVEMKLMIADKHSYHVRNLNIPQIPVIGADGVCTSTIPINDPENIQLPRKRKDGWLEVTVNNIQEDEEFGYVQSRENRAWKYGVLRCISHNESGVRVDNDTGNSFTSEPRDFKTITIRMRYVSWTTIPKLVVQGIEFRPM